MLGSLPLSRSPLCSSSNRRMLAVFGLWVTLLTCVSSASLNAEILVSNDDTMYATLANFGTRQSVTGPLVPILDSFLCLDTDLSQSRFQPGSIVLVPRGNCTFETKAYRAQLLGASGILIYNTLESRYGWNETTSRVIYPQAQYDYECNNGGESMIPSSKLRLDPPPYNGTTLDPKLTLTNTENLCNLKDPSQCESQKCFLTGPADKNDNQSTTYYRACCAWDVPLTMGGDDTLTGSGADQIFAVFITMQQGQDLMTWSNSGGGGESKILTLQVRPHPKVNASSFLLWLLAIGIVGFASWYSAKDYRQSAYKLRTILLQPRPSQPISATREAGEATTIMTEQETLETGNIDNEEPQQQQRQEQTSAPVPTSTEPTPEPPITSNPDVLELNAWHALVFVIVASTLLLLLFYFAFYRVITILYGIGCSGAMAQLIFTPIYKRLGTAAGLWKGLNASVTNITVCGLYELTWLYVLAYSSAYAIGAAWLYVGFTAMDPSSNAFFWITQDIMGACLCILFLSLLRLNSIKVATVLLMTAFLYDIFFVFLTPYIFDGDSIMVTVATSGGPPEGSDDFCDKYPSDSDCQGGDPLPMLLTMPRIHDYQGGSSLLGLGDIVLPGLLISFSARLDAAKRLIATHTSFQIDKAPLQWYQGYLPPLIVAYAVGLLMANIAVVLMERGQPALLYLVPACLGTIVIQGWHEIGSLWTGPEVIRWADQLVQNCNRALEEGELELTAMPPPVTNPVDEEASMRSVA